VLASLDGDERMAGHHRVHAVRAHLLEMTGAAAEARAEYETAARLTLSVPEQRYLRGRASRLSVNP
jgi:predicted RNA polymerase sigma factor